jgi:hypothetical protein
MKARSHVVNFENAAAGWWLPTLFRRISCRCGCNGHGLSIEVSVPIFGLCDLFDPGIPLLKERGKMTPHEHLRCQFAQRTPWSFKSNLLAHASAVIHGRKVMFMLEVRERTRDHDIAKVSVGPQNLYAALVSAPQSEMPPSKGHRLAFADQARRHSLYCLLSGRTRHCNMKINAQTKQKAPFYRCIDPGF